MSRSQEISKWFRNLQHSKKLSWISYVLLGAVLFFALMNNVKPEQLDVTTYSIAKKQSILLLKLKIKLQRTKRKKKPLQKLKINIHIKVSINKIKWIL